jgi:hypothetical protein
MGFRFEVAPGLGLGLLTSGILWPSCCEYTPIENDKTSDADKNKYLYGKNSSFMISLPVNGAGVPRQKNTRSARTRKPGYPLGLSSLAFIFI